MDMMKIIIEKVLYPVMEKKNGNQIRLYIKEMQKSERLAPDIMVASQIAKLRTLINYVSDNVPAYQEFSCKPVGEETANELLSTLPILTKKHFSQHFDAYKSPKVNEHGVFLNKTGGSTSEPVKFYLDRYTVEHYEAARWRGLSWWGITPGSKCVMIWGNAIELASFASLKHRLKERILKNRIAISAYKLNPSKIHNYVKSIDAYRPEYIYGYASALSAFATLMIKHSLSLESPLKAVVSTAETLHDYQRNVIERAFKCKAVNEYGARDGGILAYECKCGKMHATAENAILEVVDEKTGCAVPNGTVGTLLVTDLHNFVMPRLRYKVGDRAALSNEQCECGVTLPLIDKIDGRTDDMLLAQDGTYVHGHIFNHIARNAMTIDRFQLVQHSREQASLKLIPAATSTTEEVDAFIRQIHEKLPGVTIKVDIVQEIPTPQSGKFRYAIRAFDL